MFNGLFVSTGNELLKARLERLEASFGGDGDEHADQLMAEEGPRRQVAAAKRHTH